MKSSQYAKLVEYSPDKTYLYSTLYKTIIKLDSRRVEAWKQGQWDHVFTTAETRKLARKYLVSDGLDEFPLALHYLLYPPGMPRTLYVTAVITMQCNMACVYCHEMGQLNSLKMEKATARKTGQFISRIAGNGQYERIALYLYGGEPLMNMDAMETIVACIREHAQIPIAVFISTNALLLTERRVDRLIALSTDIHLQITVDGPASVHDMRRPKKGRHASTYSVILNNISNHVHEFSIAVRTNVDKENIAAIPNLLDNLLKMRLLPDRICWYAFPVASIIDGDPEINAKSYTNTEWATVVEQIWRAQADRNIPMIGTELGDGLCGISRRSVFTIDASGGIHQCTGLHSRAESVYATIDDNEIPWKSDRPEDFTEQCRTCVFFPFCGGGCKAHIATCGRQSACSEEYFRDILPVFLRYKYSLF